MIKASDLHKKFDHRGIAGIHGLSFSLNKGEVLGIMGPNGSGKTTLLKILSGELNSDKGSVTLDGEVKFFSTNVSSESVNIQKFLLNAITLDIDEEKKIQLTRDLADTFEFTFQLRQNLKEVSSGQRQKVLLAKELINRPALILLDEPFAHLDPLTRTDILNNLFQFIRQQEISVVWVTHDLVEAYRYSDKIGLMNHGKFEQIATPEILLQNPRNLFVAKFVGYNNFSPVKWNADHWESIWGSLPFTNPENQADALLTIPDASWIIGDGIEGKVVSRKTVPQATLYLIEIEGQLFSVVRPIREKLLEPDTRVMIKPSFTESFLIPL